MRTAAPPSDLEAAAQAMLAPVKTASRAEVRATLAAKCPRFVPSSEPVLPMKSPRYWARRAVENVPHTDEGVAFSFGGVAVSAQAKRVAA